MHCFLPETFDPLTVKTTKNSEVNRQELQERNKFISLTTRKPSEKEDHDFVDQPTPCHFSF